MPANGRRDLIRRLKFNKHQYLVVLTVTIYVAIPGTNWIGGWIGPGTRLDILETEKSLVPSGIRNPDHPTRRQITIKVDPRTGHEGPEVK